MNLCGSCHRVPVSEPYELCAACEESFDAWFDADDDSAGDAGAYGSDADYVTDPATGLGISTQAATRRGLGHLVP